MAGESDSERISIIYVGKTPPNWLASLVSPLIVDCVDAEGLENEIKSISGLGSCSGNSVVVILSSSRFGGFAVRRLMSCGASEVVFDDQDSCKDIISACIERLLKISRIADHLDHELGLVGRSRAAKEIRKRVARAASLADTPVLITGPTGSGKMFVARCLHQVDLGRADYPFRIFDCGASSGELFSSEFFGHVRGAFTGAEKDRLGAIASAGKGTLVLDEIGDLPSDLQAAMLGVLQEMQFRPVGSDRQFDVQCRIVSATNRTLRDDHVETSFRDDLYFRLDGLRIELPPLEERREDIPVLFKALMEKYLVHNKAVTLDTEVEDILIEASFPGNVRQLEMVARITAASMIDPRLVRVPDLPRGLIAGKKLDAKSAVPKGVISNLVAKNLPLDEIISACGKHAVQMKIEQLGRNHPTESKTRIIRRAARRLGISERTVYNRLNGSAPTQGRH